MAALVAMSAGLAHGATGDFTIYPTYMHGENKTWIVSDVEAGETRTEYVTVENVSGLEQTIDLIVLEAESKEKSFTVKENEPFTRLGLWTKLPQNSVHLLPHEKIRVPVEIAIPENTDLQEYTATILAAKSEKNPQNITIVTRIGVRMYINVVEPGTLNANIFGAPGTSAFFLIFSFVALIAAIFYNVIHYLEQKKYENQQA
ncbi:MAG TPA: hypothetical protein VI588_04185 [Candidatus Gracilibacteria bacterium]|nr:hypothetical protein [Candidatus Gracilibacteria bacterium]